MGNFAILTRADRELLQANGIDPEKLVIAHRSDATICFLNHRTRDNILVGGRESNYEPIRPRKRTKEILRRNGIDPAAVEVTLDGQQDIRMVSKKTQTAIYLARGDRRW